MHNSFANVINSIDPKHLYTQCHGIHNMFLHYINRQCFRKYIGDEIETFSEYIVKHNIDKTEEIDLSMNISKLDLSKLDTHGINL